MLGWYHARLDGTPKDRERVLISVDGACYMATFYENTRVFFVEEPLYVYFIDKQQIYWAHPADVSGFAPK
jgi:hypothetical protein